MKKKKGTWDFDDAIMLVIIAMVISIILSLSFASEMKANMASIIGGILSAIATVFVGLIGIWQNKRYKKIADEANDVHVRPEFFNVYCDLFPQERYNLPSVTAKPERWLEGRTAHEELFCICKVLDFPVVRLKPKNLRYFDGIRLLAEFNEFDAQNEPNQIFEKDKLFRIFIPQHKPLSNVELVLEYENIYGDVYIKIINFNAPSNGMVPEASVFGTYNSGQIIMQPSRNVKSNNN
jgi:hypothetical protein